MRQRLTILSLITIAFAVEAGERPAPDEKAVARFEDGPLYLGSINSGFKANDEYFDANINLVAPVWSSLGSGGLLGGGIVFLEPYVSWGEHGEVATSLGLGWRYLFNDQQVSALRSPRQDQAGFWDEGIAIGANFFVDMLDTEADNQFWQLGFGVELATRYIEVRGNYYLPLTDKQLAERKTFTETRTSSRTTTKPVTQTSAPYDDGQGNLVQDQTTSLVSTTTVTTTEIRHILERYEEGMEGWDAEIAVLLPGLDKFCDVKLIGGYFSLDNAPFGPQEGGTGKVEGWKAGVEVRPVPAVALTTVWYEDERFLGSNWMVGARMEIPFEASDLGDGKGMWGRIRDAFTPRRRHLVERLAEPVHRQNAAIHLTSKSKASSNVSKKSTSSSTQVVSQTKNKIVLGPAPSATEFKKVGDGTLTLNGSIQIAGQNTYAGATVLNLADAGGLTLTTALATSPTNAGVIQLNTPQTANIQGTLYTNKIGGTIFIPGDNGLPIYMPPGMLTSDLPSNVSFVSSNSGSTVPITTGATLVLSATPNLSLSLNRVVLSGLSGLTVTGSSSSTSNFVSDSTLGALTLSGSIATVSSNLIKSGTGTLVLSGANTYTGATTVNGGTLVINGGTSLTSATATALVLNNGSSLNISGTGLVRLASITTTGGGGIITVSNSFSGTIEVPSIISGAGRLVLTRDAVINGTQVQTGDYSITNGAIFVNGGSLQLSGATISVSPSP